MKTPTLIVRLIGLYLIFNGLSALWIVHKTNSLGPITIESNDTLATFQALAWAGLAVGLVCARYAGPIARLLTFDSEPREKTVDLSDRLLESKP